jgi:hypothetical protein
LVVRFPLLVSACLLFVAAPATAQQFDVNAPPGNSAVDQYVETIPSATGNSRTSRSSGRQVRLPQETRSELRTSPLGDRLAGFTEATGAGVPARGARRPSSAVPEGEATRLAEGDGESSAPAPSTALERSLLGSEGAGGGMGVGLPLILGAITIAGIALSLRRPVAR